ncbi:MAG: hypothetical protein EA394_07860 [Bacteroidia bacterium]|nr:MAG: hypothetical protein EA394_07860 [Bacteroidia bacterium]
MRSMNIRIRLVAFRDAPAEVCEQAQNHLTKGFPNIHFTFADQSPDVICFASGGSEEMAVSLMEPGRFYLLLAGDQGNAYAAATEVKAWADLNGRSTKLVTIKQAMEENILVHLSGITQARHLLQQQKAALIGEVSHWLVASHFPLSLARDRFGINMIHLPWKTLPDYLECPPDQEFLNVFAEIQEKNLEKEARIHTFIQQIVTEYKLDGVSVECFSMVKDRGVTACLSLALLNSQNILAACEGDLVSLTGMMVVRALTGHVPWMANVASINHHHVLFAHCTAPLHVVRAYSLPTHFETDKSAAVQGVLDMEDVTIYRLNAQLNKAFIAEGKIVSRPQHDFACRTQVEVALSSADLHSLRENPLGNHHLIIPGRYGNMLRWFGLVFGLQAIQG